MPGSRPTAPLVHLVLAAALFAANACKTAEPNPTPPASPNREAKISSELTASAQVTAIDPAERRLTLRREDGTTFEVQADASVRNLDQIAVGDTLRVRYRETLAAAKLPAGTSVTPVQAAFGAGRARPGEKPGAGMGLALRLRVRIESIDRERDIVVYALASGGLVARRLQTAEGRAFVAGLLVGDVVQLDYTESLALGIEKL